MKHLQSSTFNLNTLKSCEVLEGNFKMVFEKEFTTGMLWFKKTKAEEVIILGETYKGCYKKGEPCFRKICFDDPRNPILIYKGCVRELVEVKILTSLRDYWLAFKML